MRKRIIKVTATYDLDDPYVIDCKITPREDVEKMTLREMEEIFAEAEGYLGVEVEVIDEPIIKNTVDIYKDTMIKIFNQKYNIHEYDARKLIYEFDFDGMLEDCDYVALHDEHEEWVDAIMSWNS